MTSAIDELQQEVFLLMRQRLVDLFGPGGSFRVSLARASGEDAVFVDTIAQTIAWDVAAALDTEAHSDPRRLAEQLPEEEHEAIWRHVEEQLLSRRKSTDSIPTGVRAA